MGLLGLGRHCGRLGRPDALLGHAGLARLLSVCALVAVTAVMVPLTSGQGCVLDQAQVTFVPPASARILATYACGALTCWERWVDTGGRRLGHGRACEAAAGDSLTAPPRAPVDPG